MYTFAHRYNCTYNCIQICCDYAIHIRSASELHVFPPEVGILQLVSVQGSRDVDVFSADADHLPTKSQVLKWKKVELFKKVDILP